MDLAIRQHETGELASSYLRFLSDASKQTLDVHWEAVEKLAAALLEREELGHAEAIQAMDL